MDTLVTSSPEATLDPQWVVAYYDLLGIRREMAEWNHPQNTCNRIALFRESIAGWLLSAINLNLDKRKQNRPEGTEIRECQFITFGFADTMVIASPVVNQHDLPQPMALSMLLMAMVPLTTVLLAEGIMFRAGIDVGFAQIIPCVSDYLNVPGQPGHAIDEHRISEGDIAGPAYISAFKLASMKRSPPGAYVGKRALALLQEAEDKAGRFQNKPTWVENAKGAKQLLMRLDSKNDFKLVPDGDVWAVDFANLKSTGAAERDKNYKQTLELLDTGYQRVLRELQAEPDPKVCQKLQWLKAYLNSRGINRSSITDP